MTPDEARRPSIPVAVVGHVEWVEFVPVDRVPGPGQIAHGGRSLVAAGGGGGVSAGQLARLAGGCTLYTALGGDEVGWRARADLERLGVRVEAATRAEPQRRAFTLVDAAGERTIITIGQRLSPSGDDALPWDRLDDVRGAYFTAGDEGALRAARRASVLVATSRVLADLTRWGVPLDALVGSADDADETFDIDDLEAPPALAVLTEGPAGGRYWTRQDGWRRYAAVPPPGPVLDSYGAGDSFAAGLTYGLATGRPIPDALEVAARCGAGALTRAGAHGAGPARP